MPLRLLVGCLCALSSACAVLPSSGPSQRWQLTLPVAVDRPGSAASGEGSPASTGMLPNGRSPDQGATGPGGTPDVSNTEPRVQSGARVQGTVLTFDGLNELPLPNATVRLSDGRQATTAADGSFAFAPPPADGAYLVTAAGRMASLVSGLMGDAVKLHVRGYALVSHRETAATERPFRVSGRLVDANGQPVANVHVALEDRRGSFGLPAESAADGRFQMMVYGLDQRVEDGRFYAVGAASAPWMALAEGLDVTAGTGEIDFDALSPGPDALRLVQASHRVRLNVSSGGTGLSPQATLALVGPSGTRMVLADQAGEYHVAPLPGARFELDVTARDAAMGLESRIFRGELAFDFSQSETVLNETLLAPPTFEAQTLTSGGLLSWSQPSGVDGVHFTLTTGGPPLWEAFDAASPIALQFPTGVGGGTYRLKLAALDERFTNTRQVASLRALRALPLENSYRLASKEVTVTVSP